MLWWRGEHSLRRDSPRPPRRSGPGRPAAGTGPQGPLQHRSGRGHRPRTQQRLRDVLRRPGGTGTPARRPGRRRTTSRRSRRKGVETMSTTRPDQIHHAVREHNATALADLHPGETVLDLGSGGGIDVLLSARRVGPTGKAYGLDFTPEMLDLARRNQHEAGITNAEFLHGTIEDIPLPDASVDVIISNCVINLAVDKDRVLREAYRVLRPGGRLAISDIVLRRRLPAPLGNLVALWTGCVTGALLDADYQAKLHAAGFQAADKLGPSMTSRPSDQLPRSVSADVEVRSLASASRWAAW